MLKLLENATIAIVGGKSFCGEFLQEIRRWPFSGNAPKIAGVAERDEKGEGLRYAQEMGIFTTAEYKALFELENLDLIVVLDRDDLLCETVKRLRPPEVKFLDHFEGGVLLDWLRVEREKAKVLNEIRDCGADIDTAAARFEHLWRFIQKIAKERNTYAQQIRKDLMEREGALAQIVQGSTIPTFVIDRKHVVTYWNRACEILTGYPAGEIVGTKNHWKPFRRKKRPIMADLILDGVTEDEVWRYYGTKWKKSSLIDGAYEAEEYFPQVGHSGKWLFFTAAPIKSPEGEIIGAIETIWDKTPDKEAQEERENHNRKLAAQAEQLLASEKALAQIIQGSTVPTFVISEDHVVTHWNRAMERLTDYPADQMVGTRMQWVPFWDDERPSMADVIISQLREAEIEKLYGSSWQKSPLIEDAYEAEAYFPRLGEDGKWCFLTAAPIKAPDGKIIGAIETLWDRTESKRAEEEKDHHFKQITGLCSFYTALSTSLDLDLRIKSGISEIQRFMSVDGVCLFLKDLKGEMTLRYHYGLSDELCRESSRPDRDSLLYQVARSGKVAVYNLLPQSESREFRLLKKEGLRSLAYIPINTKEMKAVGVVRMGSQYLDHFSKQDEGILELIGNRLGVAVENSMLHEKYIKSEEKYRSLFNSDPNPTFIIDCNTLDILDINHRAVECYGYTREELIGMPFIRLGDENDDDIRGRLKHLSDGQSVFFYKHRHHKRGGIPFYVNINVSYATYRDKDVLIAAATDVTETVEKETQLIQASKMTTLGQMAAGIAHEINQPLNVIQVCADFFLKMLKKKQSIDESDLETLANDISDNVQRAAEIIKHMRDFSRQSDVVRNKVDINDPIRDVFKVMGHQLKVHNVELQTDLDPEIPYIMAEHNRLEQVFINLVSNAVDAMDEKCARPDSKNSAKKLEIRSFLEEGRVVVTVSDTGKGMPPEMIDKIFEPFFTTKAVGKGTGLGVSISYGIVKDYQGEIHIESEVGEGSTFTLAFPALMESDDHG